ncbi:Peptidyl-prolyl cis-trans isomerase PIN4 [Cryomyces minteri]|uniref:Peptidyl-prolyl cis-trans isomerase n=1 Tax=Cryomyces minteri TaxID=331657 RepID=A0A4U0XLZ1_9PEZI|nr:Peptidyl-prolyl cis-trans isomerase PIN4 [Cryomyces minteri]
MAPKSKAAEKTGNKGKGSKDPTVGATEKSGGKAKGAQSINVRHILCEKHAKKEQALAKLREGVKFDEVAREFSEDKARQGTRSFTLPRKEERRKGDYMQGLTMIRGALGWKTRGALLPEFERVAFELEPSTTGNPKYAEVKTSEGYHIVMVEGRK